MSIPVDYLIETIYDHKDNKTDVFSVYVPKFQLRKSFYHYYKSDKSVPVSI
jgi:hypothetical protein